METSTSNRQFTNTMKSYGFKTRRRSLGVFYEGVEYNNGVVSHNQAFHNMGMFSGFDNQNIFEELTCKV